MGLGPKYAIADAHGNVPLQYQEAGSAMLSGSHCGGLRSGLRQSTASHHRARRKVASPQP